MAVKVIFLEEFGKAFVPKKFIPGLRMFLLKAGVLSVPYKFFGGLFYLTALMTAVVYIFFLFPHFSKFSSLLLLVSSAASWFLIQIGLAFIFILLVYFYLDLKVYKRTREMEDMLPDFLQMVASNLKGGLSFENALLAAIKPRFSILANEMSEVAKKLMTGHDVSKALSELSHKYDSPMLRRSIDLMISEIESGGEIASLIDKIVDNIKETQLLKEEISTSAVAYVMFISAIVIVIAPLLFALSYNLLIVTLSFMSRLSSTEAVTTYISLTITEGSVNPDDFRIFSLLALGIISLFSSMIVSIVEKGSVKSGLKYIPLFLIGSMSLYLIFLRVLSSVFTGIAGG
jgi:pilus assembly protein TadC